MKDEFISTVSHELRTPLTSLRAALGLLAGGALTTRPEKPQQMLEIAISNTDRLVRLVNDILDLERIGSGKAELQLTMCSRRRPPPPRRHPAADRRTPRPNIRIFYAANGVSVWADPDRILQMLNNLISNAIKFSPPGSEIHLTAKRLDEHEALIEVEDQGRGIPADKLENIFDRFQQGDASDSRAMGGTGLGLAICRSIVAQHGGRIWATSTPGKGNRSPLHPTHQTQQPPELTISLLLLPLRYPKASALGLIGRPPNRGFSPRPSPWGEPIPPNLTYIEPQKPPRRTGITAVFDNSTGAITISLNL